MKHLSIWAKHNPLKARTVIVLIHVVAMITAAVAGIWLYTCQYIASPFWLGVMLILLSIFARRRYPVKTRDESREMTRSLHLRRSRIILALTICGWLYCFWAGNRSAQWADQPDDIQITAVPAAYSQISLLMTETPRDVQVKTAFKWWKIKKKGFFHKIMRHMRERSEHGGNNLHPVVVILLALLTIFAFIVLAFLIWALACNLSCSGHQAAAIAVALVGGGLLIFGLISVMSALSKVRTSKANEDFTPKRPPSKPAPKQ